MPESNVSPILESLKGLLQYKVAQQQAQLESQKIDIEKKRQEVENKRQQAEEKRHAAELKERQRQFDEETNIQKQQLQQMTATHALNRMKEAQGMMQSVQEGAPLPPGTTKGGLSGGIEQPKLEGPLENITPAPGTGQPLQQQATIPLGPGVEPLNFSYMPPKQYAEQQAERERISLAPKTEAQIKVKEAEQKAETDRRLKEIDLTKEYTAAQNAATNAMHIQVAKIQAAADKYRTDAMYGAGGASLDSPGARITMGQFNNGGYTLEQLPQLFKTKGEQNAILKSARDNGIKFMTNKEKVFLNDLQPAARAEKLMEEFNNLMATTDNLTLLNPLSDRYQELAGLQARIKEDLAGAANTMKTAGRFTGETLKLIQHAEGVFMDPIRKKRNIQNMLDYKKLIGNVLNAHLSGYSPGQKAAIMENHGFEPRLYESEGENAAAPVESKGIKTVKSEEDYKSIEPGEQYMHDGQIYTKKGK